MRDQNEGENGGARRSRVRENHNQNMYYMRKKIHFQSNEENRFSDMCGG